MAPFALPAIVLMVLALAFVHRKWFAPLAVPAMLCLVLSASRTAREFTLGLFALAACIACATIVSELRCRRTLRRAEHGVHVQRSESR